MSYIELHQVTKRFDGQEILTELDLAIMKGEFLVVLGASGGGKTTLLNLIAGLLPPTSGQITFDGKDITHTDVAKRNVAYVFQDYALYPHMTVGENIRFPLENFRLSETEIESKTQSTLEMLKLTTVKDFFPRQLSGGQKQRVAMGRAIVRDPVVFLFDEPLSSLDQQLRDHLRMELKQLHRQIGKTFVYVTHDQTSAMVLGDRIAFLNCKKIQQIDSPKELYRSPINVDVAEFLGFPAINLLTLKDFNCLADVEVPRGSNRVGIRPEHLRIKDDATGSYEVEGLQEVGYACYVNIKLNGRPLCGKCDGRDIAIGQRIRIDLEEGGLLFFDENDNLI